MAGHWWRRATLLAVEAGQWLAFSLMTPLQISGSLQRLIVGGEYYPDAYRKVRDGREYGVALDAEPSNRHDPNAVACFLEGQLCGYLARDTAEWFQPLALVARQRGQYLWTLGRGERLQGEKVVRLTALPDEREMKMILGLPVPPLPARGKLKRLGESEAVIERVLGRQERVLVPVVLTTEATPSGKYAGQSMIRATLDGQTLGLIPAQYRDECPDLFVLVEQTPRAAEADVRRYDGRPWIRVTVTPTL